jgi:hypothetical protein
MRTISPTLQSYTLTEQAVIAQCLIYIYPRDRSTNAIVPIGFWTGDDHETITVDGSPRLYYGAGNVMDISDPITYQTGVDTSTWRFSMTTLTTEFEQMFRVYDPRLAAIEVHRAVYYTSSGALVEAPHRLFKGWIETCPIDDAADVGETVCNITCVTSALALTKTLALYKSDAFQKTKSSDRMNKYSTVSGSVPVVWGQNASAV